jgi:putative holliday junction resolvase
MTTGGHGPTQGGAGEGGSSAPGGATGRVLALDVGGRRLGVAVSDPTGTLALPLVTVERTTPQADAAALAALAAEHGATTVVAGLPIDLAGRQGPAAQAVRAYLDDLAARLPGLSFELVDERLTTVVADRALAAAGVPGRRRRAVIDQVAASVFLQSWLDARAPGAGRDGRP